MEGGVRCAHGRESISLKTSGSEALLAAQWRQRYETCLAEKEEFGSQIIHGG
jgi:hypothetical protein